MLFLSNDLFMLTYECLCYNILVYNEEGKRNCEPSLENSWLVKRKVEVVVEDDSGVD